jgi:hypothetical protein
VADGEDVAQSGEGRQVDGLGDRAGAEDANTQSTGGVSVAGQVQLPLRKRTGS